MIRQKSEFLDETTEDYLLVMQDGSQEPLDRILEMLDEQELAIEDLLISDFTRQYLAYVSSLQEMDIEKSVYFAYYASVMVDLKVRSMLPKTEEEEIQFEEDRDRFFDTLSMRQLLNEMRKNLESTEVKCRYFVEPEFTEEDCNYCINNFSLDALIESYLSAKQLEAIRGTKKGEAPKVIAKDRFTVLDKSKEIVTILKEKKEITFADISSDDYTKSEIINAFLALLELLKRQFAEVEQDFKCGEIKIKLAEGAEDMDFEKLFSGDYDSYEFDNGKDKAKRDKKEKDTAKDDKETADNKEGE